MAQIIVFLEPKDGQMPDERWRGDVVVIIEGERKIYPHCNLKDVLYLLHGSGPIRTVFWGKDITSEVRELVEKYRLFRYDLRNESPSRKIEQTQANSDPLIQSIEQYLK